MVIDYCWTSLGVVGSGVVGSGGVAVVIIVVGLASSAALRMNLSVMMGLQ